MNRDKFILYRIFLNTFFGFQRLRLIQIDFFVIFKHDLLDADPLHGFLCFCDLSCNQTSFMSCWIIFTISSIICVFFSWWRKSVVICVSFHFFVTIPIIYGEIRAEILYSLLLIRGSMNRFDEIWAFTDIIIELLWLSSSNFSSILLHYDFWYRRTQVLSHGTVKLIQKCLHFWCINHVNFIFSLG